MPLDAVEAQFEPLIDAVARQHERVEITRAGVRAAILMSADDYDSLMETVDILADAELVQELREALDELAQGQFLSTTDVLDELPPGKSGRR